MSNSNRFSRRPTNWFLAFAGLVLLLSTSPFQTQAQSVDDPSADQDVVGVSTTTDQIKTGQEYEYKPVGDLPDWIENFEAEAGGDGPVPQILVSSKMRQYTREAENELWENAETAVARYLDERIAAGAGRALNIDRKYIQNSLIVREHTHLYRTPDPRSTELGDSDASGFLDWHRSWAKLAMDDKFDEWAGAQYEEHLVHSRVLQTALLVFSGIALLGIVYGFLHMNHRTRGFYSGRLQTISLVSIVVVIVLCLALSNSFEWL